MENRIANAMPGKPVTRTEPSMVVAPASRNNTRREGAAEPASPQSNPKARFETSIHDEAPVFRTVAGGFSSE